MAIPSLLTFFAARYLLLLAVAVGQSIIAAGTVSPQCGDTRLVVGAGVFTPPDPLLRGGAGGDHQQGPTPGVDMASSRCAPVFR
ncbi:MAG TPA: hypothetical protein VJT31_20500 [Rugosimonospora sp.]|nr:hypothetical protein [Rugosimonospora sp.]